MKSHYYGTVPALDWILARYYYKQHRVWIAEEFYTYRLPNPKSSDPILIYQDLYQPWRDLDDFDKTINQSRANLHRGVQARQALGHITAAEARRLKRVCNDVDIVFFYPLVLRVDVDDLRAKGRKLTIAGSGSTVGSHEFLAEDLVTGDFELLFLDYDTDADFQLLVHDAYLGKSAPTKAKVDKTLAGRC